MSGVMNSRWLNVRGILGKSVAIVISLMMVITLFPMPVHADSGQRWNLGAATNTGKDNGYSGDHTIDRDDPHYGWTLGQFYVSGFTQRTSDSDGDVFLKNVGDQVELHFELLQDIDCLNECSNLSINADTNGYDQYFSTQQFNDCRGLLIIRKTDYQNATADPVIYTDYLDGVNEGADTVVELCEEGDYEVALDYEIKEEHYGVDWNTYVSVPTYTNYRIYFTFKIRNGNCMVFPFDCVTGSELTNESFTENGFYLDLANSRYLEINVQRSVYVEGSSGYTEDIRFNRPASDGTQYTDEGIYTITVSNLYTDQTTTKVIYVGTDPIMRAYVVTGCSLEELQRLLEQGYMIADDGTLIAPVIEEEIADTTDIENEDPESAITSVEVTEDGAEETVVNDSSSHETRKNNKAIPVIVVLVIIVLGIGVFVYFKRDLVNTIISNIKNRSSNIRVKTITSENDNDDAGITASVQETPVDEVETRDEVLDGDDSVVNGQDGEESVTEEDDQEEKE